MSGQAPESRKGPAPANPPAAVQPPLRGTDEGAPHISRDVHAHHPRIEFRFLEQLKHRNVIRVGILYLLVCWLILDPVHVVFHMLEVPVWANRLVVVLMAVGFPSVLLFAWVYEITPEGLKLTVEVEPSRSIRKQTGQRLNRAIFAVMAVALTYFAVDKFWLSQHVMTEHPATPAASVALDTAPATTAISDKSIAVLPFLDMSEKKDQEYFADGMAEEIIDLLATIPSLKVIGRTSSFQFKGKNPDLREVGKTLTAAYVLEGSVRRARDRIRVSVQLIDARDGMHRWSESYDRPIGDVLAVQDDIAAGLARTIQVAIGAAELPSRATSLKPEVYNLLLLARAARERLDRQGAEDAIGYYEQALKIDPTCVPAAVGLADASMNLFLIERTDTAASRLRAAIDAALKLDPSLAEMHALRANLYHFHDLNWTAAAAEIRQALQMAPNDVRLQFYVGGFACSVGRWDEGMRYLRAVIAYDPLSAGMIDVFARCLLRAGRYLDAEQQERKALSISPTHELAWTGLGKVLLAREQLPAALDAFGRVNYRHIRLVGLTAVNHAMGRHRESDEAMQQLERDGGAADPYRVAQGHAYRGELEQALKWLELAGSQKDMEIVWAKGDPAFARYTGDPRYRAWLRKMNLPD
jgi:adenylate cyclase